jgi:beta-hydroxylase
MIILIIIITIVIVIVFLCYNPHYGLYPYNYLVGKCINSQTFYHGEELLDIFPQSVEFEAKWMSIRAEAQQVLHLSNENVWREFISAGEEFWKGWNVFTLRLYGIDVEENMARCPILARLLKRYPHIHTAVFSILEPGKVITPHYGPNKGVLRYHLGLIVPNSDNSERENECYLKVGDDTYYWKEGEGVLFDETYLHSAHNDTDRLRIVLYLDIPRPMPYGWLNELNDWVLWTIENSSYNRTAIRDRT